jgi:hypothetical protein
LNSVGPANFCFLAQSAALVGPANNPDPDMFDSGHAANLSEFVYIQIEKQDWKVQLRGIPGLPGLDRTVLCELCLRRTIRKNLGVVDISSGVLPDDPYVPVDASVGRCWRNND